MPTSPKGWLEWMQAGDLEESTITLRAGHFNAFARHVDPLTATTADIAGYLATERWATETRRSHKATLRSFYKWARRTGLIAVDPTEDLHAIKPSRGMPKPIPEPALAQALRAADRQQTLMLTLGAYAGLRKTEMRLLRADAVTDLGLIIRGKGGVERRVPIHDRLRPLLSGADGWMFPSPRIPDQAMCGSHFEDRILQVLPTPYTAHCLRHRFATSLLRSGVNIRVVQKLLGHAKLETTALYLAVIDDELDDAIRAVA